MTKLTKKVNRTNKRRLAEENECRFDLKTELPLLFEAFIHAHQNYEFELRQTPPQSRSRGFEASLLNSKMIQSIQESFPEYWRFGKYKRFTLRVNGYTILFKKFDSKGQPMNIKTKATKAISEQTSLTLFADSIDYYEPILFFGYQKNPLGLIFNPKLIYIDEYKIKWTINADSVVSTKTLNLPLIEDTNMVLPKLKIMPAKKASGQ